MSSRLDKLLSTIIFIFLLISVFVSYSNPARTYELSIYSSSPLIVLFSILSAILFSTYLLLIKQSIIIGVSMSLLSILIASSLPIIRGYYFLNENDTMSILGRLIDLNTSWNPLDSLYPAPHLNTASIELITGLYINHSIMLTLCIYIILYTSITPFCVGLIRDDINSYYIGFLSAILILPTTRYGIHYAPNFLASLSVPLVLYSLFRWQMNPSRRYTILYMSTYIHLFFVHPQVAFYIAIFSLLFSMVMGVIGNWPMNKFGFYTHATILILSFLWIMGKDRFTHNAQVIALQLLEPSPGESASASSFSLGEVGGSVVELFLKLFTPHLVFLLVSGILFLYIINETRGSELKEQGTMIIAVIISSIVLILFFLANFMINSYYLRIFALAMPLATILGALFLTGVHKKALSVNNRNVIHFLLLLIVILQIFSLAVFYPSPYIYQDSDHVSKAQFSGYELAITHASSDHSFNHIRSGIHRYVYATQGRSTDYRQYTEVRRPVVPDHFNNQELDSYYDSDQYLSVTNADRTREIELYNEFRFSKSDFEYLESNENVEKVISNGEYDLYVVNV